MKGIFGTQIVLNQFCIVQIAMTESKRFSLFEFLQIAVTQERGAARKAGAQQKSGDYSIHLFLGRLRHGEPDPGARPRLEDKGTNQESLSPRRKIGLAIAGVFGVSSFVLRGII